jgi:hypothetical protein
MAVEEDCISISECHGKLRGVHHRQLDHWYNVDC